MQAVATLGATSAVGTSVVAAGTADSDYSPVEASVAALVAAQAAGALSAESLVHGYLRRIERHDHAGPEYRSVLALNPDVLAAARALDAERHAGKLRGPLHGLPILIKDNIATADRMATTAGSRALAGAFHRQDAPLVARLRAAGALVLGKANLSEWANFRSTRSCSGWSGVGGQTRNAYDRARNPSGSSAGSAVATAASFCTAAIGSETDGSILAPSSLNGVVGLKPTIGLVSGAGIVPLSPRQDTAGPIGRCVADVVALARVIAEQPLGYGAQGADLEGFRLSGVRIGTMPPSRGAHPDAAGVYAQARTVLAAEGAILIDLEPPKALGEMDEPENVAMQYEFKAAIDAYLAGLDPAFGAARNLVQLIDFNNAHAREELALFGQELFELSAARGPLTDRLYLEALHALDRTSDREGLAALFAQQGVEVLIAPGSGPADLIDPVWGDRPGDGGWPPIASAAAIAGYPSLTVPAGMIRGLPIGLVLVAPRAQDGLLLQVGRAFERASGSRVAPVLPA